MSQYRKNGIFIVNSNTKTFKNLIKFQAFGGSEAETATFLRRPYGHDRVI